MDEYSIDKSLIDGKRNDFLLCVSDSFSKNGKLGYLFNSKKGVRHCNHVMPVSKILTHLKFRAKYKDYNNPLCAKCHKIELYKHGHMFPLDESMLNLKSSNEKYISFNIQTKINPDDLKFIVLDPTTSKSFDKNDLDFIQTELNNFKNSIDWKYDNNETKNSGLQRLQSDIEAAIVWMKLYGQISILMFEKKTSSFLGSYTGFIKQEKLNYGYYYIRESRRGSGLCVPLSSRVYKYALLDIDGPRCDSVRVNNIAGWAGFFCYALAAKKLNLNIKSEEFVIDDMTKLEAFKEAVGNFKLHLMTIDDPKNEYSDKKKLLEDDLDKIENAKFSTSFCPWIAKMRNHIRGGELTEARLSHLRFIFGMSQYYPGEFTISF